MAGRTYWCRCGIGGDATAVVVSVGGGGAVRWRATGRLLDGGDGVLAVGQIVERVLEQSTGMH